MNSKNRNRVITLAESVIAQDKKDKTIYPASSFVEIWNAKFNLVPIEQLPALKNQVELEVAAIRGANASNVEIATIPYANFQIARVLGTHMPDDPEPQET